MIKKYFPLSRYIVPILGVLALPVIYFISRYNYNLFHSFADGVSIVIAVCAFTIIWNSRRLIDNNYFLYVGISFLFFALLDLTHVLGNKDMGVFPEYGNLGPALYIASRYVLSISLLIAPLFINRKLNTTLMFAVYSSVTSLIFLSIFYWQIFPVCIVEGVGLTPFKVISDYIICLILSGGIVLLLINRKSFESGVLRTIVFSIILLIATGLTFTLYMDPFGLTNMFGHLLQIASFYLVYVAFIETSLTRPQEILYRKLKQNEETLTKNFLQLDYTNLKLNQEMTERKRAEEEIKRLNDTLLAKNERLEFMNKELESFSYSVSHDLRAPLRHMSSFAELLKKRLADNPDEQAHHFMDSITRASKRMGVLIDDLLAFSRIGHTQMQMTKLSLNDLVKTSIQDIKEETQGRDLAWEIDELPDIYGDQSMLKLVFDNLISNAVKYTRKCPQAKIQIGAKQERDEWIFFIKDNGVGFDMKYVDRLFGVFQRLHTRNEFEGTGIGLANVQRIISRHGGRVWAEGSEGQGAAFYFSLLTAKEA